MIHSMNHYFIIIALSTCLVLFESAYSRQSDEHYYYTIIVLLFSVAVFAGSNLVENKNIKYFSRFLMIMLICIGSFLLAVERIFEATGIK